MATPGCPNIEKVLVIFADVDSKIRLKVINWEVNVAAPATTKYLYWAKTHVRFDQLDHPANIAPLGARLWSST